MSVEVFPMANIPPKVKAMEFIAVAEYETILLIKDYNYLKENTFLQNS